jgi:DNA-binding CsgD family transcriptional regulator
MCIPNFQRWWGRKKATRTVDREYIVIYTFFVMKKGNKKSKTVLETLTPREREVFDLLLEGDSFKEIGYKLKISYNTVMGHQRNMYRKLSVNSVNELLTKYSKTNETVLSPLVDESEIFIKCKGFNDFFGSHINVTQDKEKIKNKYFQTYTLSGIRYNLHVHGAYCVVEFHPHPSILEIVRKMTSFSVTYLGDGNAYDMCLSTTESFMEGGQNHYRKIFRTEKNKISTLKVNINELHQLTHYGFGKPVPFVQKNINYIQIEARNAGEFNLKVWDFRFYL